MTRKRPNKGTKAYERWHARVERNRRHVLWSQRVLRRDGHRCIVCGQGIKVKRGSDGEVMHGKKSGRVLKTALHAHHLLDKIHYPQYRFIPKCGVALCFKHHKFGQFSAHRGVLWFADWLRQNRPEQYEWCMARVGEET